MHLVQLAPASQKHYYGPKQHPFPNPSVFSTDHPIRHQIVAMHHTLSHHHYWLLLSLTVSIQ